MNYRATSFPGSQAAARSAPEPVKSLDNSYLTPTPLIDAGTRPRISTDRRVRPPWLRPLYVSQHLLVTVLRICWLKLTRRLTPNRLGTILSQFFLRMGVLWIKVGQLLSMRADLLPVEVCDELARLQDFNQGFAFDRVRRVFEEELGLPLDHFFTDFEEVPFAAASIAQVHRARLKEEGVWAAVKIQMPDSEANFKSDMLLVRFIVWLLTRTSYKPHVRWKEMLWEIDTLIREELDYRYEATNMRRMRNRLRKHSIHVPKVFARYCTRRVLVMEYVSGVLVSEYGKARRSDPSRAQLWLQANNISPPLVARRVMLSMLRQTLEDNLFHGDLHPGNVVLLRDNQVALIDFGSVSFSERELLRKYDLYMQALHQGEYVKMADLFLLLADRLPPRNLSEAKERFSRKMQEWERSTRIKDLPYQHKSMSAANDELIRIMAHYGIAPAWDFLRQTRAVFTFDATLRELWPECNVFKLFRQYYRKRAKRLRRQLELTAALSSAGILALLEAPVLADEYMSFHGTVIRRSARVFEGASNRIAGFFSSVFNFGRLFMLVAAVWLLAAWAYRRFAGPGSVVGSYLLLAEIRRLDIQLWIVLAVTIFYLYRTLARLGKEFSQESIWESAR